MDGTVSIKITELPNGYEFLEDLGGLSLSNTELEVKNNSGITWPDLNIKAAAPSVTEGEQARFVLELDKPWNRIDRETGLSISLVVEVEISETEDVRLTSGQGGIRKVIFSNEEQSVNLDVTTLTNAQSDHMDASVVARVTNTSSPTRSTVSKTAEVEVSNNNKVTGNVIRVADVTVMEGGTAQFHLKLDRPQLHVNSSVTVKLLTTDLGLPAQGTAQGGKDFNFLTNRGDLQKAVEIPWPRDPLRPWKLEKRLTLQVTTNDDDVHEYDEVFGLQLTKPIGISLGPDSVNELVEFATITDDADMPELTFDAPKEEEGGNPFNNLGEPQERASYSTLDYQLTFSRESLRRVRVYKQNALRGTAESRSAEDMEEVNPEWVDFPPGTTSKMVKVRINGDADLEPDETLVLRFSRLENATFANGGRSLDVTGTILNDDGADRPTIRFSDAGLVTEGKPAVFRVELLDPKEQKSIKAAKDYSMLWTTESGPRLGGADRTDFAHSFQKTATIAKGSSGVNVEVQTYADQVMESDEIFSVLFERPTFNKDLKFPKRRRRLKAATITDKPAVFVADVEK